MRALAVAGALSWLLLTGACANSSGMEAATTRIRVVAAENFWGSIAAQLGGDNVAVTSIITWPGTDPHAYEPTPQDVRTLASAQLVIVNGLGYDSWAIKALSANPTAGRTVVNVGELVRKKEGDNPHRWYFPDDVQALIARTTDAYKKIDPKDAGYFDAQRSRYESDGLAKYKALIAQIKQKYAGTKVGASESIFVGIAQSTGLDLVTPSSYLTAVSEGTDPAAHDKSTVDRQIGTKEIKVFVYNSQNATPDVQTLVNAARAVGIPVTTVTETLTPANASFQDWQSGQLQSLADALARATGR